jgi:hypothetical protein
LIVGTTGAGTSMRSTTSSAEVSERQMRRGFFDGSTSHVLARLSVGWRRNAGWRNGCGPVIPRTWRRFGSGLPKRSVSKGTRSSTSSYRSCGTMVQEAMWRRMASFSNSKSDLLCCASRKSPRRLLQRLTAAGCRRRCSRGSALRRRIATTYRRPVGAAGHRRPDAEGSSSTRVAVGERPSGPVASGATSTNGMSAASTISESASSHASCSTRRAHSRSRARARTSTARVLVARFHPADPVGSRVAI